MGSTDDKDTHGVSFRRMMTVNIVLGAIVIAGWAAIGGSRAVEAIGEHWQVSLTMTLGSLVGGGTSEGGGAVAFPILTKVLAVPPEDARLFSFAIQSVGMTAASLSILWNRVPLEWAALAYGGLPGVVAVVFSFLHIAPRVSAPHVRLLFTAVLVGLMIALIIGRRYRPARRPRIFERRTDLGEPALPLQDKAVLVLAGSIGGLLSGIAAVGENTIMFVALVLLFRVSEKTVTPTTVVLMTMVTLAGFAASSIEGSFTGPVVDMWLAAVPVVCIGAPLGALICTRLSSASIARILYVLITVELVSTVALVPIGRSEAAFFASGILVFTLGCLRLATLRRFDLGPDPAPTGLSIQRDHVDESAGRKHAARQR
ncbi:sulfite exporter TauE/SafE family protein [Nocardia sp. CNY236]|uniref:sulfite exporter TauE/SafE family protein n=1 Tax=Nocardia sp. CNY236 TaxID=1169152 RepID=UPI000403DDAF|nr:sulfite exporter TauE/SafE family protein [Nocardia sp. CNY236]